MDITKIDSNFKVETTLKETDIVWYDIKNAPVDVYGFYNYKNEPIFRRTPHKVAAATSANVERLHTNTSGGRVRFFTDSPYIAIKSEMPSGPVHKSHMSLLATSGFDLYADFCSGSVYSGSFIPPQKMKDGYESIIYPALRAQPEYFTINFPLYNNVANLYIGIKEGSVLKEGKKYTFDTPVVFYGSSITQGACASRPGNMYENFISRRYDTNYLGLGFSGSCKGEDAIVEYMTTLDMSVFVSDYDHNAPDTQHLLSTHMRVYEKIREKHPTLPYIMISRPGYHRYAHSYADAVQRRDIVYKSYITAINSGDKNVYFIDGERLFGGECRDACTSDGVHPNDLGFYRMADVIGSVIKPLLRK